MDGLEGLPLFAVITGAHQGDIGGMGVVPLQVQDLDKLKAGDLVCSNCGAAWPGGYNPFWLKRNGTGPAWWYHWCTGGRPGSWHPAELANSKGGGGE